MKDKKEKKVKTISKINKLNQKIKKRKSKIKVEENTNAASDIVPNVIITSRSDNFYENMTFKKSNVSAEIERATQLLSSISSDKMELIRQELLNILKNLKKSSDAYHEECMSYIKTNIIDVFNKKWDIK